MANTCRVYGTTANWARPGCSRETATSPGWSSFSASRWKKHGAWLPRIQLLRPASCARSFTCGGPPSTSCHGKPRLLVAVLFELAIERGSADAQHRRRHRAVTLGNANRLQDRALLHL